MGNARTAAAAALLIAALVSLAGCAAGPPGYPGTPTATGQPLRVDGPAESGISAWSLGESLVVTTTGSGSCPVVPDIDEIDDDERRVYLHTSVPNAQGPCTADSSPRTFELDAGRNLTGFSVQITAD